MTANTLKNYLGKLIDKYGDLPIFIHEFDSDTVSDEKVEAEFITHYAAQKATVMQPALPDRFELT